MPRHNKGLSHQLWWLKEIVVWFAFIHQKERALIFSKSWIVEHSLLLKILLFLSFQISQVQENEINCIMERRAFDRPTILLNWIKWFVISAWSTPEIPNHLRTRYQMDPKQQQSKNKLEAISGSSQPFTQSWESLWIIPRWIKLSLVVNLLWKSHHTNTNIFKGTPLWGK